MSQLDSGLITLGQFRSDYIQSRTGLSYSRNTIRADDLSLRSLADFLGDNCRLRSINQSRIEDWQRDLVAKGLKPQSINSYLRHIRAALNKAVEQGLLRQAPRLKNLRQPKPAPRHLDLVEVRRLLDAETNYERRRVWVFCLWTGARRQEAAALQWNDIHLVKKPYAVLSGKGQKQRLVPLLPVVIKHLGPPRELGPVFTFTIRGKKRSVSPDTLSHWFKKAAKKAGLPRARLHDLRHTAATYMLSQGVPVRFVQEILGHANITTTEGYSKALVVDAYDVLLEKMRRHKNGTPV